MDNALVRETLAEVLTILVHRHAATLLNLQKAGRWFPVIEEVLANNKIPDDFKYLAVVESNLSNLISRAGAVGFWQFMPETAKEYGLILNEEVDERYDALKSTQAAARYFREAYLRFKNWNLVAASYNMGMEGLRRRLEEQKGTSYFDLFLNPETGRYIYYAAAIKCIFENPALYGYHLKESEKLRPLALRKIPVQAPVPDLAIFARQQGFTYFTLKTLNPWLRANRLTLVSEAQPYEISLPLTKKK
ncbi:MAG: lytic transglycosylase domain-containing protein [Microscillaceae bacterium]|nr:lytic transglycosylase domain-containing protein [Microscillaceae bacterium]